MKTSALLLVTLALLAACNTIEGAGKDLGNAGESISDAAHKTKAKINGK